MSQKDKEQSDLELEVVREGGGAVMTESIGSGEGECWRGWEGPKQEEDSEAQSQEESSTPPYSYGSRGLQTKGYSSEGEGDKAVLS